MIMSEIKKNIETCRGEDVLAEVSGLPQDPHFGSLVAEALDPLKQQALHQAGYDGYSEVIEQHKPYTFASAIIQMKSNLLLLLRALWQFPFGSGTLRSLSDDASLRSLADDTSLRSLADMWQHYITRLQGNETYGIHSRLSSLTDLPSAPLLVADRKISGVPNAADGISLVQLLSANDARSAVTELDDDNEGWTNNLDYETLMAIFPNIETLSVGCSATGTRSSGDSLLSITTQRNAMKHINLKHLKSYPWRYDGGAVMFNCPNLETLTAPELESFSIGHSATFFYDCPMTKLELPSMKTIAALFIKNNTHLKELIIPNCTYLATSVSDGTATNYYCIYNCTALEKVVTGIKGYNNANIGRSTFVGCPKIRHLELGEGVDKSINLSGWNPDSETLAHQDFLPNFRTYIALRLATFASNGPTLTLSQAVYDAIKDESHLFVFPEGTMTIYAYLTNIKHWTVTK